MTNGRRPNLEVTIEQITPNMAKEMLEFNTHNRKVRERLVQVYASAMRNGDWRLNGETIIFDKTGRLQSGQHRLLACIDAGVPFWSIIVRGADPAALFTLDTGSKRQLSDALTLRGEMGVSTLAAAIVYRWRYENGLMPGAPTPPSVPMLLAFLEQHPSLREHVKLGYKVRGALGMSAGMYGAMFDVFSSLDVDNALVFTDLLCSGEGLESNTGIFAARRWIIRSKLGDRRPSVPTYAAITVKAWNAWREHRPVKSLVWRAEDPFPEAI